MANWLTHLRVAQSAIKHFDFKVNEPLYYIGTIAADCGTVHYTEDKKQRYYIPAREVTHFTENIRDWDRPIHYDHFYDRYIKNETDRDALSFYYGYYLHLLTDALWIELASRPVVEQFETIEEYRKMAKDLYRKEQMQTELDFLIKNAQFYPFKVLNANIELKQYLDFATPQLIQDKIKNMLSVYTLGAYETNINYLYFTPEKYESILVIIERMIRMILNSK